MNFSERLRQSRNYDESFEAYSDYIAILGLQSMSYTFIPESPFSKHNDIPPKVLIKNKFTSICRKNYKEASFKLHEHIVGEIRKGKACKVYFWEEKLKRNPQESPRNSWDGCSILTAKSLHGTGIVSVVTNEKNYPCQMYFQENKNILFSATETFHNHVITHSYEIAPFIMQTIFVGLTSTERKVLKCLLDGLRVPEIANVIYRSKGHVENLVREIRIKVGGELPNGKPSITKDKLLHFCGLMKVYEEL